MYKFGHLLLLIFFVAFVSCEKAENDANGTDNSLIGENYKLADGVVLVDDAISEQFVSVESGRIIMSSSANNVPTVNSILLAPITSITPNGMLVRIISVEKTPIGYVLVTEPAALQDAFEELHISGSFDISEFVDKVTDNDGNLVTADLVSSDIWSEFAKSPEDTTAVISTKASGHTDLSIRFPVSTGAFSGYVFSDFLLDMDIDISKRKLKKFDIRLNKQTGLSGTLRLKVASGFKLTLVEAEYNFKPFWIPNTPIVVRPKMYIEESFEAKGEIDMKSSLRFLSEDQIYSISFNGENTTFDSKKNPHNNNYLKFDYLNADAQMELSAVCGVKFAFLNDDLLAFGVESDAKQKLILHDDISMDDKGLLVQNPTIDVIPSITASLYCESVLLDVVDQVEDNRISYIYDFGN